MAVEGVGADVKGGAGVAERDDGLVGEDVNRLHGRRCERQAGQRREHGDMAGELWLHGFPSPPRLRVFLIQP